MEVSHFFVLPQLFQFGFVHHDASLFKFSLLKADSGSQETTQEGAEKERFLAVATDMGKAGLPACNFVD